MKEKENKFLALNNYAIKYLSRFESSEFQIRKHLEKKMRSDHIFNDVTCKQELLNKVIKKLKTLNYINDERYSEFRAEKILANGGSKNLINFKLRQKGIKKETIQNVLNDLFKNSSNEIFSALIFMKKKKIGIFHVKNDNDDIGKLKNKWYGMLARKGFAYETVEKAFLINNISMAENIINGVD